MNVSHGTEAKLSSDRVSIEFVRQFANLYQTMEIMETFYLFTKIKRNFYPIVELLPCQWKKLLPPLA
jgi:hypothetical protein